MFRAFALPGLHEPVLPAPCAPPSTRVRWPAVRVGLCAPCAPWRADMNAFQPVRRVWYHTAS